MESYNIEKFLRLETEVWNALATGDIEADTRLLSDDFLGVYGNGFSGKNEHISQLKSGPAVATFNLSEARLQVLCEDIVLLSYRADWVRFENASDSNLESMYVTSIWKNSNGTWKNIFSQDTLTLD